MNTYNSPDVVKFVFSNILNTINEIPISKYHKTILSLDIQSISKSNIYCWYEGSGDNFIMRYINEDEIIKLFYADPTNNKSYSVINIEKCVADFCKNHNAFLLKPHPIVVEKKS